MLHAAAKPVLQGRGTKRTRGANWRTQKAVLSVELLSTTTISWGFSAIAAVRQASISAPLFQLGMTMATGACEAGAVTPIGRSPRAGHFQTPLLCISLAPKQTVFGVFGAQRPQLGFKLRQMGSTASGI